MVDHAAIGRKSRRKGKTGEREVIKLISPWWQQLEPEAEFITTPMSGGWSKRSVRAGYKVSGDVSTTAEHWPFTVEVKRKEGWKFGSFETARQSPVWSWWRQSIDQAAEEDREPMLWFRKNEFPWVVLLPERLILPIVIRLKVPMLVVFQRTLPQRIDHGGIRPAAIMGTRLVEAVPPQAFVSRQARRKAP